MPDLDQILRTIPDKAGSARQHRPECVYREIDVVVSYLDTKTGKRYKMADAGTVCIDPSGSQYFWEFMWADGNWSCDCNRGIFCGLDEDVPCNTMENRIRVEKIVPLLRPDVILYAEEATPCPT